MLGRALLGRRRDSVEERAERARDIMFGAMDGMIDTIATVAGVAGVTGNNFIILVAGLSALVAEAAAMGFSSYQSGRIKHEILAARRPHRAAAAERPLAEGLVFWAATLGGGLVILLPFALSLAAPLAWSTGIAALLLFGLGWRFAQLARRNPLRGALETTAFGLLAAAVTFLLGSALAGLAG